MHPLVIMLQLQASELRQVIPTPLLLRDTLTLHPLDIMLPVNPMLVAMVTLVLQVVVMVPVVTEEDKPRDPVMVLLQLQRIMLQDLSVAAMEELMVVPQVMRLQVCLPWAVKHYHL